MLSSSLGRALYQTMTPGVERLSGLSARCWVIDHHFEVYAFSEAWRCWPPSTDRPVLHRRRPYRCIAPNRCFGPRPDSCDAAKTGRLDARLVARFMCSAGGIYCLVLRDFGGLMIEENIRSSDLTTREDNHGVWKRGQRDCCCSDRHGDDGRGGSGRRRCKIPGLERTVDALVSPRLRA